MKKPFFIILLAITLSNQGWSQSCLPDGITFSTQTKIDSFQISYPNCVKIEGDVLISGTDINNLSGLNVLSAIGADFKINSNTSLLNLSGLNNLTTIEGDFSLWGNTSLESLTGIESLNSIDGGVSFGNSPAVHALSGLENLTTIGDYLEFGDMDSLTDISAFSNLTFIGGYLWIGNNDVLAQLSGLNNVTTIGRNLILAVNYELADLTALSNITTIGGKLRISRNPKLSSLNGLENIAPESITDLEISLNPILSTCEVKSICDYLASPNGVIYISGNAIGCQTPEEVEEACLVKIPETNAETCFFLFPNPAKNKITIAKINGSKISQIKIFDTQGQLILNKSNPDDNIDISPLKNGFFIVEFISNNKSYKTKLIVNGK